MKENKNIDQFFKDKFDDFEANPPEEIWQNIEEKLQKKKKRKIIPFWWYSSGVAALFVIGLFVFNNFYTLEIHPVNDIVIENNTTKENSFDSSIINEKRVEVEEKTKIVSTEKNKEKPIDKTKTPSTKVYKEKESLVSTKNSGLVIKEKNEKISSDKIISNKNLNIVSSENNRSQSNKKKIENRNAKINQSILSSNNTVATNAKSLKNKTNSTLENKFISSSKEVTKINEKGNKTFDDQESIVKNNTDFNTYNLEIKEENNIDLGRIAMKNQDNVAIKGEVNTSIDSIEIATIEPNELEELLKEKENQIAQEEKINRWQVTPNLAPVYFGSFADGSPLDSNLDENTKSYNNNLSYGVAVNYSVNKKLKIRTGINSFTVDYNTNDLMFFQSSNARMMKNIDPTAQGSVIEIVPIKNINPLFNKTVTEQNTGILNQKMGYIEMPIEISYSLLNKKFGIELIGGMSTMLLSKNEVFLEADGMNMKIGEASNLNPVHFSTNIGVGLNYGFYKKFQARIEPTFKYQINTFSRDSQNFKPYIFGIYTGISYNF